MNGAPCTLSASAESLRKYDLGGTGHEGVVMDARATEDIGVGCRVTVGVIAITTMPSRMTVFRPRRST